VGEAVSHQTHDVGVDRWQLVERLVDGEHHERVINAVVLVR
jgi:hypothetical protein